MSDRRQRMAERAREEVVFNWKSASLAQLYCIAYADEMALPSDRQNAAEEIMRRLRRKREDRVQYRIKEVYPK